MMDRQIERPSLDKNLKQNFLFNFILNQEGKGKYCNVSTINRVPRSKILYTQLPIGFTHAALTFLISQVTFLYDQGLNSRRMEGQHIWA